MENTIQNKILQKIKEVWNKDRISQRSRNYLGIVYLCLATFTSILALGFFGAAFATDHWKHISVNRIKLEYLIKESKDPMDIKFEFNNENIYYDRVEGLFKVCFPNAEKPNGIPQNVWGQSCVTKNFGWKLNYKPNSGGKAWAALNSLTIIAFGFYFVFSGAALVMGMAGCGGVSKQKYGFTSILMGLAFVPGLIGMGLFHATNFYERNMVSFFSWNLFLGCANLESAASEISCLSLSNGPVMFSNKF